MEVEPIRDPKKIKDLKKFLNGKGSERNYCLIFFGMNSALRISDIVKLKWADVFHENYQYREIVHMKEIKTKKNKGVKINNGGIEALNHYLKSFKQKPELDEFIFISREMDKDGNSKPITRAMAWRIVKEACAGIGLTERIGTHTLRKTWGYWAYKGGMDIGRIMEVLNHTSVASTKHYIGIRQDDINDAYDMVVF
jgi:integrase